MPMSSAAPARRRSAATQLSAASAVSYTHLDVYKRQVLAQRNGVEPPKKSAFLPWRLHYPRERYCFVDGMFLARLGEGAGGCLGRYPSPGANGIGDGRFARSVLLAGVTVGFRFRLPPKARFFGAPPRFFAQEQRNGVDSQDQRGLPPNKTAHTHKMHINAYFHSRFVRRGGVDRAVGARYSVYIHRRC